MVDQATIDAALQPLEDVRVDAGMCRWTDVATAIGQARRVLAGSPNSHMGGTGPDENPRATAYLESLENAPASHLGGEKLGRFDHHPDPAIDFCIEVEALEGHLFDARHGIGKPGEPPRQIDDAFRTRVRKAMEFCVGGDEIAVAAKQTLRQIEARIKCPSDVSQQLRQALEALYRCGQKQGWQTAYDLEMAAAEAALSATKEASDV